MSDPTYDAATQTVADDDGGRISIFDLDDCPKCGGHLIHAPAMDPGDVVDMVLCANAVKLSASTCDVIAERNVPR